MQRLKTNPDEDCKEFQNILKIVKSLNSLEEPASLKVWVKVITHAPLETLVRDPKIVQGPELVKSLIQQLWQDSSVSHSRIREN